MSQGADQSPAPWASPVPRAERSEMYETLRRDQEERRSSLRGKRIAVITSGSSSKRFIFVKLKELGVEVMLLDSPGAWSQSLAEESEDHVVAEFIPVDVMDEDPHALMIS